MSTPVDFESGLTVGVVEQVSPATIEVRILNESPHGTALGARAIQQFPTINGHVAVPTDAGAILGMVSWVGIDRERLANTAHDAIDMPAPRRRMRIVLLGLLGSAADDQVELSRGVPAFPTVGDRVRLLTPAERRAVHKAGDEWSIRVGTALTGVPTAVEVDPNRLYGRHLAVLGNTGSGKSCSVVHLLRQAAQGVTPDGDFRCIVLDANGEFSESFNDLGVPVTRLAAAADESSEQLRIPGWLWNSAEWRAALGASGGAQLPYLRSALRLLRAFASGDSPHHHRILSVSVSALGMAVRRHSLATEEPAFPQRQDAGELIVALRSTVAPHLQGDFPPEVLASMTAIVQRCADIEQDHRPNYWNHIPQVEWTTLSADCDTIVDELRPEGYSDVHEDDPVACDVSLLRKVIEEIAAGEGLRAANWAAPLLFRFDALLADPRVRDIAFAQDEEATLGALLEKLMPARGIVLIDLSLVPVSVVHVVVAVIARLIFEAHENVPDN